MTRRVGNCVVIGLGNPFRSDDGVGVVVAGELCRRELPPSVEVIDAGADEFGLIEHFRNAEQVILVDAVSMGAPPGTVRTFSSEKFRDLPASRNLALHTFGLADVVELCARMGIRPRVTIVGIEPQSTAPGDRVSELIRRKVPDLVEAVLHLLRECRKAG